MTKTLLSLAVILCLMTHSAHASIFSSVDVDSQGVQDAAAKKTSRFLFLKKTLDDLAIDGKKKSLRDKTRIAVPFFRLNFVTEDKYRNTVRSGIEGRSSSKVKSSLSGVTPDIYQAVTDEMYADFIRQLQSAGYEIVPNEELKQSEKFSDMESDYPKIDDDVAKITASSMPFPGKFRNPASDISKAVNAVVLQVDLDVDYLIINKNEKRFNLTKDVSHVDVTQGISVEGLISAFVEDDMTTILIQQPVTSNRPFASVLDETSALSKANDALVLASGWLSQGGLGSKRQTSKKLEVVADSQQYRLAVGDALVQLNRNIAGTLAFLRDGEKEETHEAEGV